MIESTPLPPHSSSPARRTRARIAVAHDWLCGYRGGEAVLERIAALVDTHFEPAALYAMFDDRRALSPTVDAWRARGLIRATGLGASAAGLRARRWLLPLYPALVRTLSRALREEHAARPIDLLISSSSAAIKGLRPPAGVPHLCYCHGPARYVWSRTSDYGGGGLGPSLRSLGLRLYGPRFRAWDRATAATVTRFIANSTHTAAEINRCYGASASVVHPPVRTGFFTPDPAIAREAFWLVVGALEPYKRIDAAIEAAAAAGRELVIAGDGSQRRSLERLAAGRARFLGRVSEESLRDLYRRAGVLLFPQVEDFGIVAAEAQACGLPVVARRAGGALDIIRPGSTGAFFDESRPTAIAAAAASVTAGLDRECRRNAERFGEAAFDAALVREIRGLLPA